jgi:hypothetical protein
MDAVAFRDWAWEIIERNVDAGEQFGTHVFRLIAGEPAEPEPVPTSELLTVLDQELSNRNIEALGCVVPVHSWLVGDVRLNGAYFAVVGIGMTIQQRVRVTTKDALTDPGRDLVTDVMDQPIVKAINERFLGLQRSP